MMTANNSRNRILGTEGRTKMRNEETSGAVRTRGNLTTTWWTKAICSGSSLCAPHRIQAI